MSTVYVLGAGASKEATKSLEYSMPLASEFFEQKYIAKFWPQPLNDESYAGNILPPFEKSELRHLLLSYYDFDENKRTDINIEELFSFIESRAVVGQLSEFYPERLRNCKAQLLAYIYAVMRYLPWGLKNCALTQYILKKIRQGDSILTFNWDLIFDEALEQTNSRLHMDQRNLFYPSPGDPNSRSFFLRNDESRFLNGYEKEFDNNYKYGSFLKLHGSINYMYCETDQCTYHHVPIYVSTFFEAHRPLPCPVCGERLKPLIMPPSIKKSYSLGHFFRRQASIASEVLKRAENIVVIGYSFPQFDFEAIAMFRTIRNEYKEPKPSRVRLTYGPTHVSIVNPLSSSIPFRNRINEIMGANRTIENGAKEILIDWYESFDQFIEKNP